MDDGWVGGGQVMGGWSHHQEVGGVNEALCYLTPFMWALWASSHLLIRSQNVLLYPGGKALPPVSIF